MDDARLSLEERKEIGRGKAQRLRRKGYVPCVIYGQEEDPRAVQVKTPDLKQFLSNHGKNALFHTEFAAEHDFSMFVKDIQYDPVRKDVIHADFQRVSLSEKMHAEVPVRAIGVEKVEKGGSVVVHQLNEVVVECLPQDVPRYIDADISAMTPGYSLTARQLKLPQGVNLVSEPDAVILSVTGGKQDLQVEKTDEQVVPAGEEGEVQAKPV